MHPTYDNLDTRFCEERKYTRINSIDDFARGEMLGFCNLSTLGGGIEMRTIEQITREKNKCIIRYERGWMAAGIENDHGEIPLYHCLFRADKTSNTDRGKTIITQDRLESASLYKGIYVIDGDLKSKIKDILENINPSRIQMVDRIDV